MNGAAHVAKAYFVKVFLDTFDGKSDDMKQLSSTEKWVWMALLGFARHQVPHGYLNIATDPHTGAPIQASFGRLAQWAMTSKAVVHRAISKLEKLGMLKLDCRAKSPCYQIANWEKWQVGNGAEIDAEETEIDRSSEERYPTSTVPVRNDSKPNRSCEERQRSCEERYRSPEERLLCETDRSPEERQPNEVNGDSASSQPQLENQSVPVGNGKIQSTRERLENVNDTHLRARGNGGTSGNEYDDTPSPSEANMYAAHGLSAAVTNAQPQWSGRMQIVNSFCQALVAAIRDKNDPDFTEATVLAALQKWPPRSRDNGAGWLRYVAGKMFYEKNPRGKKHKGIQQPSDLSQMKINPDGTVDL